MSAGVAPPGCQAWTGDRRDYQDTARAVLADALRVHVSPIAWITPRCGFNLCINPDHLTAHEPKRIEYPYAICIYCGGPGWTKDHLYPRGWSGEGLRQYVATVPACGTCNSLIGDTHTTSITERREICHERLRRKHAKTLRTVDRTPSELEEFGPTLRSMIETALHDKRIIEAMLTFPDDLAYDMRALQKSGIEDPYAIGILTEGAHNA